MAGINVGSVLVDVLPDARGWDEKLSAQVAPAAERVGRSIGKQIEDDIADGVRRGIEKGKLEAAASGDVKVHVKVDEDSAARDVKAAAERVGSEFGSGFASSAAKQGGASSPLIMAAVAGGLIAGGPLLVAAAGVAFGGLAAVILHNQKEVADAASEMATEVKAAYVNVANAAIPELTFALGKLRNAAIEILPQVREVFRNVGPAIQGVTDGVIGLAQGAMPGLIAVMRTSAPVFDGLRSFLTSIGTGLSDMFRILSEHAPAFGQVFSSLGDIVGTLLPILGDLMAAGGELGTMILPPLAAVLGLVRDVLHDIAPILPEIAIGFGAFKVVSLLEGPLESFALKLGKVAENGGMFSGVAGKMSGGLSGIAAASGPAAAGVAFLAIATQKWIELADKAEQLNLRLAQAMHAGGIQADAASRYMDNWAGSFTPIANNLPRFITDLNFMGHSIGDMLPSVKNSADAYDKWLASLNPLAREQALVAQAQRDLNDALSSHDTEGAAMALGSFKFHTAEAAHEQALLDAALHNTSVTAEENKQRLQGIANAAGAGSAQINLLKSALDQLTGAHVSVAEAESAFYAAVAQADGALKDLTGSVLDDAGSLNLHSEAGRKTQEVLLGVKDSANTWISTMISQNATSEEVLAKDAELRDGFYQTALRLTGSASAAEALTNRLYGIPEQRHTEITADTAEAQRKAEALAQAINNIQSKSVWITTYLQTVGNPAQTGASVQNIKSQIEHLGGAIGGIVHPFADGGFQPMQGGIAQIVAPQTYRVIGDRVTDDEAYIPINNSLRSLQILSQTANRMNFDLAPAGARGSGGSQGGRGAPALHIERYYEGRGSNAHDTAEELAWMARTRG